MPPIRRARLNGFRTNVLLHRVIRTVFSLKSPLEKTRRATLAILVTTLLANCTVQPDPGLSGIYTLPLPDRCELWIFTEESHVGELALALACPGRLCNLGTNPQVGISNLSQHRRRHLRQSLTALSGSIETWVAAQKVMRSVVYLIQLPRIGQHIVAEHA